MCPDTIVVSEETTQDVSTEESSPSTEQAASEAETTEDEGAEPSQQASSKKTEKELGAEPEDGGKGAHKRINKLVAEREYWRGVAEGRIKPGDQPAPGSGGVPAHQDKPPVKPTIDQFTSEAGIDYEGYEEALELWREDKAVYRLRQETRQTQATQQVGQVEQQFQERMEKAYETDPELRDVFDDPDFLPKNNPMSFAIAGVVKSSEEAPRLIRYLYDNPAEVAKLYKMNPLAAALELGRIQERLLNSKTTSQTKKVSDAPPPAKTATSKGSSVDVDEDSLSMEEFARRRNKAQYGG